MSATSLHIYPSIFELTVEDFLREFSTLLPYFDHFQLDIADGVLVDNRTIQIENIIDAVQKNPLSIESKTFEIHLMVEDFEQEMQKVTELKKYLNITSALIHLQPLARRQFNIPQAPYAIGVSLNPEDEVQENWKNLNNFDIIQLMTVPPGKQAQAFVPEVLDKISELRELGFEGNIILDGAINDTTLPIILSKKYLPDAVCPGSYFKKEDPQAALQVLQEMLNPQS